MVGGVSGFSTCGDDTCRNIIYQSKCGALARVLSKSSLSWGLFVRHEIYWAEDCPISMMQIKGAEGPLKLAIPSLLANLIISIITNFVVGIVIPICLLYAVFTKKPTNVKETLKTSQKKLVIIFSCVKIIPESIVTAYLAQSSSVILRAAAFGSTCADPADERTSLALHIMGAQLSTCTSSIYSQLAVDAIHILTPLALFVLNQLLNYCKRLRIHLDERRHIQSDKGEQLGAPGMHLPKNDGEPELGISEKVPPSNRGEFELALSGEATPIVSPLTDIGSKGQRATL
jgi:hypothetical protein